MSEETLALSKRRIASLVEFIEMRGGNVGYGEMPNVKPKSVPRAPISIANPQNLTNPLPVLLTFQRKEVRMFSDGRVVGLYKEIRTGVEIIFPMIV